MATKTLEMIITAKNLATQALKQANGDIEKIDASMKQNLQTARNWGAAVTAAGVVFAGIATTAFADFESEMSKVSAITQTTGEDFEKLSAQARELGGTTAFTAKQAAEGMTFLGMAGFETDEIMESLTGTLNLAAAANIELGRSADIASNILTGFRLEAEETDRVVDVLAKTVSSSNVNMEQLGEAMKFFAPTAAAMGISMEEASAAVGLLGNAGLQGSIATRALSASLTRLADPTNEMKNVMEQLNVEFFNAHGEFIGLQPLIGDLNSAFEGMTQQQQQAALSTLFGTEAIKQFNILLDAGSGELGRFTAELENSKGTAEEMAKTQLANLSGSFTKLKSAFGDSLISIGALISKGLRPMIDIATVVIQKFNELGPTVKTIIIVIGGLTLALVALATASIALALVWAPLAAAVGTAIPVIGSAAAAVGAFAVSISALLIPLGLLLAAFVAIAIAQHLYTKGIKEQAAASKEAGVAAQKQADTYASVANSLKGADKEIFEFRAEMASKTAEINIESSNLQELLAKRGVAFQSVAAKNTLEIQIKNSEKKIANMRKESNEFAKTEKDKLNSAIKAGVKIVASHDKLTAARLELSEEEFENRISLLEQFAAGNRDMQEAILRAGGVASQKELEMMMEKWNSAGDMATQFKNSLADLMSRPIFQTIGLLLPGGEKLLAEKAARDFSNNFFKNVSFDFSGVDTGIPGPDDGPGGGGAGDNAEKASEKIEDALGKAREAYEELNEQAGEDLRELRDKHGENIDAMNSKINDLKGNLQELQIAFDIQLGGITKSVGENVVKQEGLIEKLKNDLVKAEEDLASAVANADTGLDDSSKQRYEERITAIKESLLQEEEALESFFSNQSSLFDQQQALVDKLKEQLAGTGADEALEKQLAREQAVLAALTESVNANEDAIEEARRRAALTEFERFLEDADAKKLRLAQDFADKKILLEAEIAAIEVQKEAEIAAFDEKIVKYQEAATAFEELQLTFEDGLDSMAATAEEKVERINAAIEDLKQSLELLKGEGGEDLQSQLASLETATGGVSEGSVAPSVGGGGGGNNTNNTVIFENINISNDVDADKFLSDVAEVIQLERQGSQ